MARGAVITEPALGASLLNNDLSMPQCSQLSGVPDMDGSSGNFWQRLRRSFIAAHNVAKGAPMKSTARGCARWHPSACWCICLTSRAIYWPRPISIGLGLLADR